jgi:hypothetical protein
MHLFVHIPSILSSFKLLDLPHTQNKLASLCNSSRYPFYYLIPETPKEGTRVHGPSQFPTKTLVHVSDPSRRYSGKAIIGANGCNVWSAVRKLLNCGGRGVTLCGSDARSCLCLFIGKGIGKNVEPCGRRGSLTL